LGFLGPEFHFFGLEFDFSDRNSIHLFGLEFGVLGLEFDFSDQIFVKSDSN